jgi:hypothetical protein
MEKTENDVIIISGGVISKQIGSSITYKLLCDKCGNTESTESTVTITKGVTEISTKKCSNCGNNQIVKMKHIIDKN